MCTTPGAAAVPAAEKIKEWRPCDTSKNLEQSLTIINRELKRFEYEGYYEEDCKFKYPDSIHSEKSIKFLKRFISNDEWIEKILKEGLSLTLNEKPLQYEEDNNNSAKQNMNKLREIIGTWEKEGKVEKLKF